MGDSYPEARVLRFFFEAGRRSATQEETPEEGALRRQRLKSSGRPGVLLRRPPELAQQTWALEDFMD